MSGKKLVEPQGKITSTALQFDASSSASAESVRRQKGCNIQELKDLVAFNVLHTEAVERKDEKSIRKSKKSRRNFIRNSFYASSTKKIEKKESDVSILSAGSPNAGKEMSGEVQDLKSILESMHPGKPATAQLTGLRMLEMLSYDPICHSSIHEPSVVQSIYFFIRAPPGKGPPEQIQWELMSLAASILANVCNSFPKLADDLIVFGMYKAILKILPLFIPLLSSANEVVELAIEKVVGLLANLQAKKRHQTLPYSTDGGDEEEGANPVAAGDEVLSLCIQLVKVKALSANRSVMLCLRNLMQEPRLLKRFLGNEEWMFSLCEMFSFFFSETAQMENFPPEIVADWLGCFSLFAWHVDEMLPGLLKYNVIGAALSLLEGPLGTQWAVQLEGCRLLSFVTSIVPMCDTLKDSHLSSVFIELLVNPHSEGNPHTSSDSASLQLKFVVNVLANVTIGEEEFVPKFVSDLLADERVLQKLVSLLEEGDRSLSFNQIKLATLVFNIMQTKDGRQAVASLRKIKDVFRSQMSSTNKVLRDIVSRCIAELRDETKKGGEDLESEQQIKKMQERRARVIDELMHTERTYVDHLLQMVAMFLRYKAISQEAKQKSDAENAIEMHANVEALSSLHFKFLQELEKLKKQEAKEKEEGTPVPPSPSPSTGEEEERRTLGGVLKEYLVGKLDIYRTYTQNFEKYQSIVDQKPFKKFLEAERKAAMKTNKKRVDMTPQSLLITPIQRIPRYVLLLEDLLDHMSADNEDYEPLTFAFEGLMEMMEYLEDEKVRVEAMMKVNELQNRITNMPLELVQPGRGFLRDGSCLVDDPLHEAVRKSQLFLLSDILIVTIPHSGKFKCRNIIPLYLAEIGETDAVMFEDDGHESVWGGFSVRNTSDPDVDLKLYVQSEEEKEAWISALTEAQLDDEEHWQSHEAETIAVKIFTSDSPLLRQVALQKSYRRFQITKSATVAEATEIFHKKITFGMASEQKERVLEELRQYKLHAVTNETSAVCLPIEERLGRMLMYMPTTVTLVLQGEGEKIPLEQKEKKHKINVRKVVGSQIKKKEVSGSRITAIEGGGSPSTTPTHSSSLSPQGGVSLVGLSGGGPPPTLSSISSSSSSGEDGVGQSSLSSSLSINEGKKMVRVFLPKNELIRQLGLAAESVSVVISNIMRCEEMKEMVIRACIRGKNSDETLRIRLGFKSYNIWVIDGKNERALGPDEIPFRIQAQWPQKARQRNLKLKVKESLPSRRFGFYPLGVSQNSSVDNTMEMLMGESLEPKLEQARILARNASAQPAAGFGGNKTFNRSLSEAQGFSGEEGLSAISSPLVHKHNRLSTRGLPRGGGGVAGGGAPLPPPIPALPPPAPVASLPPPPTNQSGAPPPSMPTTGPPPMPTTGPPSMPTTGPPPMPTTGPPPMPTTGPPPMPTSGPPSGGTKSRGSAGNIGPPKLTTSPPSSLPKTANSDGVTPVIPTKPVISSAKGSGPPPPRPSMSAMEAAARTNAKSTTPSIPAKPQGGGSGSGTQMRGGCGVKSPVVQGGVKVDKAIGNTNSPVRKSGDGNTLGRSTNDELSAVLAKRNEAVDGSPVANRNSVGGAPGSPAHQEPRRVSGQFKTRASLLDAHFQGRGGMSGGPKLQQPEPSPGGPVASGGKRPFPAKPT
mmetsp:Transcript_13351/g.18219  ORF Transcript_13351/g.18219 Transcript_13351/m.18219 type:complete len:1644 (-) Transcript_13351:244-5175(-)